MYTAYVRAVEHTEDESLVHEGLLCTEVAEVCPGVTLERAARHARAVAAGSCHRSTPAAAAAAAAAAAPGEPEQHKGAERRREHHGDADAHPLRERLRAGLRREELVGLLGERGEEAGEEGRELGGLLLDELPQGGEKAPGAVEVEAEAGVAQGSIPFSHV